MKIGFDAKRAFLNATGLGNYSRWLIKSLSLYHPEHEYHLYTPKIKSNAWLPLLRNLPYTYIHHPSIQLFTSWWRTKSLVTYLKRDGINLYHGLSHELPLGIADSGIASIVTVHDVIAFRFPEYFGWMNRKIYIAKLKYACRTANRIVAISEQTRDDLVRYLNVDAAKINVIYQNCDAVFSKPADAAFKQELRRKYNLPERYLLCVGTIEKRKNLLLLIKALGTIKLPVHLVVIGKSTPYLEELNTFIAQHQLSERIIFLHKIPFAELPAIYQMATIFIYPSRYEGFGIPVLEALNAGVPVIAATGSCLEEAGGPGSLYVHPDDEHDLARKIDFLLDDDAVRNEMITRGREHAASFSDEKLAKQMIHLYQQTLQHHA